MKICDVNASKKYNGTLVHGSADFCRILLEDKLVAAVPGVEFGLEGYLRLSYALGKEKGKEAIERMGALVAQFT